jgi:hypothetical protein
MDVSSLPVFAVTKVCCPVSEKNAFRGLFVVVPKGCRIIAHVVPKYRPNRRQTYFLAGTNWRDPHL